MSFIALEAAGSTTFVYGSTGDKGSGHQPAAHRTGPYPEARADQGSRRCLRPRNRWLLLAGEEF